MLGACHVLAPLPPALLSSYSVPGVAYELTYGEQGLAQEQELAQEYSLLVRGWWFDICRSVTILALLL